MMNRGASGPWWGIGKEIHGKGFKSLLEVPIEATLDHWRLGREMPVMEPYRNIVGATRH